MVKFIRTTGMTRKQWLELRTHGIGGSDVSAILGLNQFRSPFQVWAEKTSRLEPGGGDNEFIHWGNIMEPVLANEFQNQTGKKVFRPNKEFIHRDYDFLRANIDRDIEKEPGFLEIKTASEYKSSEWIDDEVPAPYLLQVQHYMNVLERPYVYFCALIGGHKLVIKRIDRNEELINAVTPRIVDWWKTYVEGDKEPPVDGTQSTTDTLKQLYPEGEGTEIKLPQSLNQLIDQRQTLKAYNKDVDTQITEIDNQIRQFMKDASEAINDNYKITYKTSKRGARTLRIKENK